MRKLFDRRTRAIIRVDFEKSFSVEDLAERYQCSSQTIIKVIANGYKEKDDVSHDAEFAAASSVEVLSDRDFSEEKSSGSETEMVQMIRPRAGARKSRVQANQPVNVPINQSIPRIRLPRSTPAQGSVTSESSTTKKHRRDLNLDVLSATPVTRKAETSSVLREKSTAAVVNLDSGTTSTNRRVIDVDLVTLPAIPQPVKRKVGSLSIREAKFAPNKVALDLGSPAVKRQRRDNEDLKPDGFKSFLLKLGLPHLVAPFAKLGFSTEDDLKYMRSASVSMQREVMDKIHSESQVNLKEWMVILGALRESE